MPLPNPTPHFAVHSALAQSIFDQVNALVTQYAATDDREAFSAAINELFDLLAAHVGVVAIDVIQDPPTFLLRFFGVMYNTARLHDMQATEDDDRG